MRDGGGVHLNGEFLHCREIDPLTQAADQKFELRGRERCRSASAEKNGPRTQSIGFKLRFAKNRIQKRLRFVPVAHLLVETAIRANLRTKRNVDIEVLNHRLSARYAMRTRTATTSHPLITPWKVVRLSGTGAS